MNNQTPKNCKCANCPGASCTCGCQVKVVQPATACQCGCAEGKPCRCGK